MAKAVLTIEDMPGGNLQITLDYGGPDLIDPNSKAQQEGLIAMKRILKGRKVFNPEAGGEYGTSPSLGRRFVDMLKGIRG